MTCNFCYHYKACKSIVEDFRDTLNISHANGCPNFKDKSKIIELPCNVGDTVYVVRCNDERAWIEKHQILSFEKNKCLDCGDLFMKTQGTTLHSHYVGINIFLDRKDAEKRLEELKNG